jgi:hypothetical protein
MERVPRPSVARRQFDFGDFSQESQETVSVTHLSALGKTAELPAPAGAFMDRQAMLEYQNGETQEFPLSPILLPALRIGNCSHVMSCDITAGGASKLASQSAAQTTRKSDSPKQYDENSSGGKAHTSEAESEKDSAESEEEAEIAGRKRGGGRKTGLTDEATKLQNVSIMRVMLQSNKMLGSLLGFGRKDGTGFIKMRATYEELHSCFPHILHCAATREEHTSENEGLLHCFRHDIHLHR